jgi:hypothetical protein
MQKPGTRPKESACGLIGCDGGELGGDSGEGEEPTVIGRTRPGPGRFAIWFQERSIVGLAITRYKQAMVVNVPVPEPLVERA